MKEYYVYITTNVNKTVLYTGITSNLSQRLNEHRAGAKGTKSFTSKYAAFYLLHYERYQSATEAITREKEIKGWRREKKIRLVESTNPCWKFLGEE